MPIQRQNEEQIKLLGARLLPRREYLEYGTNLNAGYRQHLEGGGALIYDFGADRPAMPTFNGDIAATYAGLTFSSFQSTARGGPYTIFDGQSSVIYYPDATWQESGTENLFTWHWCNTNDNSTTQDICGKWDVNSNRSWILELLGGGSFRLITNATGLAPVSVTISSTISVNNDTWYFVAGFWQASTLQRIFAGSASDQSLTVDSLAAGVSVSLYNGTAPLAIGSGFNNAPTLVNPWSGYIGIGALRFATPATNINGYASRIFHETKYYYQ